MPLSRVLGERDARMDQHSPGLSCSQAAYILAVLMEDHGEEERDKKRRKHR